MTALNHFVLKGSFANVASNRRRRALRPNLLFSVRETMVHVVAHTPVVSALGRLGKRTEKFKVSLGCAVSSRPA